MKFFGVFLFFFACDVLCLSIVYNWNSIFAIVSTQSYIFWNSISGIIYSNLVVTWSEDVNYGLYVICIILFCGDLFFNTLAIALNFKFYKSYYQCLCKLCHKKVDGCFNKKTKKRIKKRVATMTSSMSPVDGAQHSKMSDLDIEPYPSESRQGTYRALELNNLTVDAYAYK